jgi:uncharacterized membrane protein YhaH (DUF805 family)
MIGRLFSFQGRIARGTFWAIKLSVLAAMAIIVVVVATVAHALPGDRHGFDHPLDHLPPVVHVAAMAALALCVWVVAAAYIKRLHDLDLSGWQYFGAQLRVLFNDGTVGPNRYGPDPLRSAAGRLMKGAIEE